MNPRIKTILYFLVCPFVLISYLLEPFTGDVKIYLGTALQTDKLGGIDQAWEIKPPGNRILFYLLSKIPGEALQYQILCKAIVAIVAIAIIYYFAKNVSKRMDIEHDAVFILSFLAFFAISDYVMLEVEWFCVLIMMLMMGLYLSDNEDLMFLAGVVVLPLFLMKGISILFAGTVFALVFFITKRRFTFRGEMPFILGCVVAGFGFVVLQLTLFPHMIQDMLLSSAISHVTLFNPILRIFNFVYFVSLGYWFIPVLAIGFTTFLVVYYHDALNNTRQFLWLALAWLFPCIMIFAQGEMFQYHFAPMIVPSIITILYFIKQPYTWGNTFYSAVALMLLLWVVFAVGWGAVVSGYHYAYWEQRDSEALAVDSELNLSGQSHLLYLDPGDAIWYFRSTSASRYTCALPVQRDSDVWDMKGYPAYSENYNDIMNYSGKYIVSTPWFFQNMTTDKERIVMKMKSEYVEKYNGTWQIWGRKE
jgi:hypothetical protein